MYRNHELPGANAPEELHGRHVPCRFDVLGLQRPAEASAATGGDRPAAGSEQDVRCPGHVDAPRALHIRNRRFPFAHRSHIQVGRVLACAGDYPARVASEEVGTSCVAAAANFRDPCAMRAAIRCFNVRKPAGGDMGAWSRRLGQVHGRVQAEPQDEGDVRCVLAAHRRLRVRCPNVPRCCRRPPASLYRDHESITRTRATPISNPRRNMLPNRHMAS